MPKFVNIVVGFVVAFCGEMGAERMWPELSAWAWWSIGGLIGLTWFCATIFRVPVFEGSKRLYKYVGRDRSPAARAFGRAPYLGKRAAKYILEQESTDKAEEILYEFQRQPDPVDVIFAEAAWAELLDVLGDERTEEAAYSFCCTYTYTEHPQRNEAQEYAKRRLPDKRKK